MSKFAIRLLTVAIYAATPGVAPLVAPAKAETGSGRHIKKHQQKRPGFSDPWSAGRAWPVTRLPVKQAGSAQAWAEASIAGRGLLPWMKTLTEKLPVPTAAKRT